MLLIFSRPNCKGCSLLKNYLGDNANNPHIKEINIMENKDLISKYNIKGAPTAVLFNDEYQETQRLVGFEGKESDKDFIKTALSHL